MVKRIGEKSCQQVTSPREAELVRGKIGRGDPTVNRPRDISNRVGPPPLKHNSRHGIKSERNSMYPGGLSSIIVNKIAISS